MRPEKIINESRRLDPQALLYSRTDPRGQIRSGNGGFFGVTGYDSDALIDAPFNILRHPDMPQGVFHLLWQTIQAGDPMGFLVKNLGQDGRHYWAFTIVLPVEESHVSVSLAARGPLMEKTQALYADLLRAEADGMDPARSAEVMLQGLALLGYADYQDYLAQLLIDHPAAPAGGTGQVARLGDLRASMNRVVDARAALMETLRTLYLIPTNMRILASRLEPSGGPVSAISDSYKRAAAELLARLNGTNSGLSNGATGTGLISGALIPTAAADLLRQVVSLTARETAVPGVDPVRERTLLSGLVLHLDSLAADRTERMMRAVAHISREAEQIKRLMAGLDQIRILGEVESGRLRNSDGGLAAIMAQLTSFHGLIHTRLTAMSNVAARMQTGGSQAGIL